MTKRGLLNYEITRYGLYYYNSTYYRGTRLNTYTRYPLRTYSSLESL
jgi:hypothetical protein